MGGSASTRRIAPRANQPPCLLEPVTAEVCKLAGAHPLRHGVVLSLVPLRDRKAFGCEWEGKAAQRWQCCYRLSRGRK